MIQSLELRFGFKVEKRDEMGPLAQILALLAACVGAALVTGILVRLAARIPGLPS